MKILVVYYSRDGHTRTVAKEMSTALSADIYEITEPKSRTGLIGWFLAGKDAFLKKTSEINITNLNPADYEYVIIGSPVWAFTMPSAIRTWLTQYGKFLKNTIFFVTMGGRGDKNTFLDMEKLCVNKPLLTASFIDKEITKRFYKYKFNIFINEIKIKLGLKI